MKKVIQSLVLVVVTILLGLNVQAQGMVENEKKFTISGSADASMFQIALTDINGQSDISTLRYTYFFNGGSHFNYKLNNGLSLFTGLALKNLGLIIKDDTSTNKYRVYSLSIPLGLKISTGSKQYLIVGGGVDFPFNYKAKSWTDGRKTKVKSNEWFSDKVNSVMPYFQLGYRMKNSIVAKVHYYPTNFWNSDHAFYKNSSANIIALTLGFDIDRKSSGVSMSSIKKE